MDTKVSVKQLTKLHRGSLIVLFEQSINDPWLLDMAYMSKHPRCAVFTSSAFEATSLTQKLPMLPINVYPNPSEDKWDILCSMRDMLVIFAYDKISRKHRVLIDRMRSNKGITIICTCDTGVPVDYLVVSGHRNLKHVPNDGHFRTIARHILQYDDRAVTVTNGELKYILPDTTFRDPPWVLTNEHRLAILSGTLCDTSSFNTGFVQSNMTEWNVLGLVFDFL